MRVVLIELSPSIGMQFYTVGIANALVSEGEAEVWVIGAAALRGNAFDRRVKLLPVHLFSGTGLSSAALDPFGFRCLLKRVADLHPDVVHITGPHLWDLPIALCLRGRYPLAYTQHDATTHKGARGEWFKSLYRRAMLRAVDCVVVHSEAIARAIRSWGIALPAISVMPLVHPCFDHDLYQEIRASGDESLAYENLALLFGRLEEYKGVWEFCDAARVLATSDHPPVKMVLAGTGRLSKQLEGCEWPPNLEIRNRLIGDDETVDLFRRTGLVVLPYSEGSQSALIPLAYLFQKPVLVTRVGALPEYVRDGVTGRVLDSNDPAILAQAISDLMSDKATLTQMGKAGKGFLLELEEQFLGALLDAYATFTRGKGQ